jgi:hypothetical protein
MAANRGYRVQMTVVDQKGYCEAGHKVGDTVLFQLLKVEGQICPSVLACVMPRYMLCEWVPRSPGSTRRTACSMPVLTRAIPSPSRSGAWGRKPTRTRPDDGAGTPFSTTIEQALMG